jgi:hypothetical protein
MQQPKLSAMISTLKIISSKKEKNNNQNLEQFNTVFCIQGTLFGDM